MPDVVRYCVSWPCRRFCFLRAESSQDTTLSLSRRIFTRNVPCLEMLIVCAKTQKIVTQSFIWKREEFLCFYHGRAEIMPWLFQLSDHRCPPKSVWWVCFREVPGSCTFFISWWCGVFSWKLEVSKPYFVELLQLLVMLHFVTCRLY